MFVQMLYVYTHANLVLTSWAASEHVHGKEWRVKQRCFEYRSYQEKQQWDHT